MFVSGLHMCAGLLNKKRRMIHSREKRAFSAHFHFIVTRQRSKRAATNRVFHFTRRAAVVPLYRFFCPIRLYFCVASGINKKEKKLRHIVWNIYSFSMWVGGDPRRFSATHKTHIPALQSDTPHRQRNEPICCCCSCCAFLLVSIFNIFVKYVGIVAGNNMANKPDVGNAL